MTNHTQDNLPIRKMNELLIIILILLTGYGYSNFITSDDAEQNILQQYAIDPDLFDVLLSDLNHNSMEMIAKEVFHFKLHSETNETPTYPIQGILFGDYSRVIFPIIVQHKKKKIKTLVLYDSGCPFIYFSQIMYNSLGIDTILPSSNLYIHSSEKAITSHLSSKHFTDINVIGQHFLETAGLSVSIHFVAKTVFLSIDTYVEKGDEF